MLNFLRLHKIILLPNNQKGNRRCQPAISKRIENLIHSAQVDSETHKYKAIITSLIGYNYPVALNIEWRNIMSLTALIIVGAALLLIIALLIPVFRSSNKVDLTSPTNEKPEWMRDMPPAETVAATMKEGKGITIYDYDEGEKLASPFAEQIEDIFRARIQADPELAKYNIDFGTDADHTLEIWVNAKKYKKISELPDERLKAVIRQAIKNWNKP